jgi:hypothetical protein
MLCSKFTELTPKERVVFIGELTHACMNDDFMYQMEKKLIKMADNMGLFDNVKIMPENDDTKE